MATLLLTAAPSRAQWRVQDGHTTADLRGIHYVGNGVAWASGTNGTILRTVDMGQTWEHCSTPAGAESLDFRAIQAFDGTTAIAMSAGQGALSRLYKTIDGCQHWKLVFTNPDADGFFDALSINAHRRGYVLGDPVHGVFALFSTVDGGDTWTRPRCGVDRFPARQGEAAFAASNQSLLTLQGNSFEFVTGGTTSRIASSDGALCVGSAHFVDLPLAHGTSSSGAFASAINDTNVIVVVGGDYKLPDVPAASATVKLFGTVAASRAPPHGYRSSVAYDNRTNTWVTVGPNGTDVSIDDGRNWRALKPGPGDPIDSDRQWNAVSLPFVVGPHGRIGRLEENALRH